MGVVQAVVAEEVFVGVIALKGSWCGWDLEESQAATLAEAAHKLGVGVGDDTGDPPSNVTASACDLVIGDEGQTFEAAEKIQEIGSFGAE